MSAPCWRGLPRTKRSRSLESVADAGELSPSALTAILPLDPNLLVGKIYKDLRYPVSSDEFQRDCTCMSYTALEHKYGTTYCESHVDRTHVPRRRVPSHHVGLQLLTRDEVQDVLEPARLDLQKLARVVHRKCVPPPGKRPRKVSAKKGQYPEFTDDEFRQKCTETAALLDELHAMTASTMHSAAHESKFYLNRDFPLHALKTCEGYLRSLAASVKPDDSSTLTGVLQPTDLAADLLELDVEADYCPPFE